MNCSFKAQDSKLSSLREQVLLREQNRKLAEAAAEEEAIRAKERKTLEIELQREADARDSHRALTKQGDLFVFAYLKK